MSFTTAENSARVKMVANCIVDGVVKEVKSTAAQSVHMSSVRIASFRIYPRIVSMILKRMRTGIASCAHRRLCGIYELNIGR